jgi:CPA1 family monovalent cation:H+ antiporter
MGGGGRVRGDDPRAYRLGDGRRGDQPLAGSPASRRRVAPDDGGVEREVRLARVETLRAAVAAAAECPRAGTAKLVRFRYDLQLRRAEEELARDGVDASGATPKDSAVPPATAANTDGRAADAAVVRAATAAQRRSSAWRRSSIGPSFCARVSRPIGRASLASRAPPKP